MIKSWLMSELLSGKTILITGSARRVGKIFALACAHAGADVVIHHGHSDQEAETVRQEITKLGRRAWVVKANLRDPSEARDLIPRINDSTPLHGLVNSAAIFESLSLEDSSLEAWEKHMAINLTAPFLLSQAFARQASDGARIVNVLDWRALRPGADHFPYTISKAALASMTKSLAVALAPKVVVNGIALGAILPPSDGQASATIIKNVPAGRWAREDEVRQAIVFALTCPAYITGEIIHLDGGRHLI
jgi:pteridine reductase